MVWNTFNQIKDWLKKYTVDSKEYVIIDEYDRVISLDEFLEMVNWKQNDPHTSANPDNFAYDVKNIDGYRFSDGDFF